MSRRFAMRATARAWCMPSMLAALGAADAERPTLVVKVDARTISIAILDQGQLLLFRTLENMRGVTITGDQLAEEVYPSVVFFQDTYQLNIERVYVAGLPESGGAAPALRARLARKCGNWWRRRNWARARTDGSALADGGSSGSFDFVRMRLDINLATRPYEDARQFWLRWGTGLAVLGIVTLALLALTASGWYNARLDRKKIGDLKAQIAERDQERANAEGVLRNRQNRAIRDKSQYLNVLIARKAFSWTKAFEDLEKVMPPRLHLVSIKPQLNDDNQLAIKMVVAGDSQRTRHRTACDEWRPRRVSGKPPSPSRPSKPGSPTATR